eukprot:6488056-Pyramimonas_sp.AAC.1
MVLVQHAVEVYPGSYVQILVLGCKLDVSTNTFLKESSNMGSLISRPRMDSVATSPDALVIVPSRV